MVTKENESVPSGGKFAVRVSETPLEGTEGWQAKAGNG